VVQAGVENPAWHGVPQEATAQAAKFPTQVEQAVVGLLGGVSVSMQAEIWAAVPRLVDTTQVCAMAANSASP
jgi:uncharacterized protein YgfB (UPF0149 family)